MFVPVRPSASWKFYVSFGSNLGAKLWRNVLIYKDLSRFLKGDK